MTRANVRPFLDRVRWPIVLALIVAAWMIGRWSGDERPDEGARAPSRFVRPPSAARPVDAGSSVSARRAPPPAAVHRPAASASGTQADLERKGLPASPPNRRLIIELTRLQPVDELVRDMAQLASTARASDMLPPDSLFMHDSIATWNYLLPNSIKVARVIEEGLADPDRVAPLVEREIEQAVEAYPGMWKLYEEELRRPILRGSGEDEYYQTHFRYKMPLTEFERLNFMINAGYYVLANLDRLPDPALTIRWLTLKIDSPAYYQPAMYFNPPMHAWIMYQYAVSPRFADVPGMGELRAALEATGLRRETAYYSVWDAPWSIHDGMVGMVRLDGSDLPVIQLLAIPPTYTIAPDAYRAAVERFVAAFR